MIREDAGTGSEKRNPSKKVRIMSNWNKTARIALRWIHLLMAWPLGAFIYTPARENETFVFFMQFVFVPLLVITGLWMWQQARLRRLYHRLRRSPRSYGTNGQG